MSQVPSFPDALNKTLHKDVSLGELSQLLLLLLAAARKRMGLVALMLLFGALLGWIATFMLPPVQQRAAYMIAADEEGSSPGWESLLSQFGLDVGGSNPAGVFQGESLVALFQTRSMIEGALLKRGMMDGDSVLLVEALFKSTKHSKKEIFKDVKFAESRALQDDLADSALYLTYKYVKSKVLEVAKPEKKQTFIHVSCTHTNRELAMAFSGSMIETVTGFYIESLTAKARKNLNVLRNQADSVQQSLNKNLAITAALGDENINPWRQTARTSQNRAVIDLQISMAVFGELTKNLQLAEIGLRKQTPLIQIIESPVYPLEKVGFPAWQVIAVGLLVGLAAAFYLLYLQLRKQALSEAPQST